MIYILNCFNLYHSPSERQVQIMLVLYDYCMCHERLETDLSCCLLQVLLSLKPLFLPSSNQWRVFWSLQVNPSPFVGYRVPDSWNGHYKIGRCGGWEAKVSEKTPRPDTAGKEFWPFFEAYKVLWQTTYLHTYFEKSTLEYWLVF